MLYPDLGRLSLARACPTGMPGTNADGKRPVKASRVEDAEDASPQTEPEMLLLTHLPRDVIGKIVTQAALDARKAQVPASAICAWMRRFCTSARMQGVPCDDYWYKLALAAFGVNPDAVAEPPPKWMRGDTNMKKNTKLSWREFFGSVCDAFFAKPTNLRLIEKTLPTLLDYKVTQRQLDETLTDLFHDFVDAVPTIMPVVKADWDNAMRGVYPSYLFSFDFWPLMGLLLLRGAEPFTEDKYDALDHEIYVAIMATRGDALSAPERLSTDEAIRRIADAVARGADVSSTYKSMEPFIPVLQLTAAVEANNPAIIEWLLDHGADVDDLGLMKANVPRVPMQYDYMRQLLTKTVYDVDEWQADWPTTERLIINAVVFFINAKETDEELFSAAENILDTALDHMEDNGFPSDFHSPDDFTGIVDVDIHTGERIGVGTKVLIYRNWMSIRNDFYADE